MDEEAQHEEETPKEDISTRAARIREEMRNGRRDTKTAIPTSQDARNSDSPVGGNLKVLSREGERTEPGDRQHYGAYRGIEAKPVGERQSDRRSGTDYGATEGDVSSIRRSGRLVASEPIPSRMPDITTVDNVIDLPVKRGRGRPRKHPLPDGQTQQKQEQETTQKKRFFKGSKEGEVLSELEAERLKEPLCAAIKDDCKYLDEALWWYSHDAAQPQIWSDLDREEIETLATVLLKRGQRNAATANFVRNVVDSSDYINTAIILVPRFIKTTQQVAKRPRKQRVKR